MIDFREELIERFMVDTWKDYTVEFNDTIDHSLNDRTIDRTELTHDEIKFKISKAIDYIIKKDKKGFFKRKSMVAMTFKKSNFIAMILINPFDKYIKLSTILATYMNVKNAIRWELNEGYVLHKFEINI